MKLIATLGTTNADFKHKYIIKGKEFFEYFSFMALKRYYEIEDGDIVIVGTKETYKKQNEFIKNFEFIEVDADSFEDVFAKIVKVLEKDSIIDLTQSFKSLGYGALLGYIFTSGMGKKAKDIYYAQVQNNCAPNKNECEFVFQSLKRYEDITELVREINLFVTSWYVLNQQKDEFLVIHNNLVEISKRLLMNDLDILGYLINIEKEIKRINKDYLRVHLRLLDGEIKRLKSALSRFEHVRLFNFSKLYFEKNLLLQSLTMLFEAVSAYVEFRCKSGFVCKSRKGEFKKGDNKYNFRNCLKSKLLVVRYGKEIPFYVKKNIKISNIEDFARHFAKLDNLRNNSAHAFINGKELSDFKNALKKEIDYFEKYLKE